MFASFQRWLANIGIVLSLGLGILILVLGLASVVSLYKGQLQSGGSGRVLGTATVLDCRRIGPVSTYGFGYWYECRVAIILDDGRKVTTRLGHSIVTPSDRRRGVRIAEDCNGPGRSGCVYARPGNPLLGFGVRAAIIVDRLVFGFGLFVTVALLVRTLLGERLFFRFFASRRPGAADTGPADWAVSGDDEPVPTGHGRLSVRLTYPGEVEYVYGRASPVLSVDGDELATGWGMHRLALPEGRHRVRVAVRIASTSVATAERRVTVSESTPVALAYEAQLNSGHFDMPGERKPSLAKLSLAVVVLLALAYAIWRLAR